MTDCDECDGQGERCRPGHREDIYHRCQECNGTGRVELIEMEVDGDG